MQLTNYDNALRFADQVFQIILGRPIAGSAVESYTKLIREEGLFKAIRRCARSNEAGAKGRPTIQLIKFLENMAFAELGLTQESYLDLLTLVGKELNGIAHFGDAPHPISTKGLKGAFSVNTVNNTRRLVGWLIDQSAPENATLILKQGSKRVESKWPNGNFVIYVDEEITDTAAIELFYPDPKTILASYSGRTPLEEALIKSLRDCAKASPELISSLKRGSQLDRDEHDNLLVTPYLEHVFFRYSSLPDMNVSDGAKLLWYSNHWSADSRSPDILPLTSSQIKWLSSVAAPPETTALTVTTGVFDFAQRRTELQLVDLKSADVVLNLYARFLMTPIVAQHRATDFLPIEVYRNIIRIHPEARNWTYPLNNFWFEVFKQEIASGTVKEKLKSPSAEWIAGKIASCLISGRYFDFLQTDWILALRRAGLDSYLDQAQLNSSIRSNLDIWASNTSGSSPKASHEISDKERPVLLISHEASSGLGNNGRMFSRALAAMELSFRDLGPDRRSLSRLNETESENNGDSSSSAQILCLNADRIPEVISHLPRFQERISPTVGFLLWETSKIPKEHHAALTYLDEVWCPTEYVCDIYRENSEELTVHNIGKSIEVPDVVKPLDFSVFGYPIGTKVFLSISDFNSSILRKDPLRTIKAFQLAFPKGHEPVRLILKIRSVDPKHWSNIDGYWDKCTDRILHDSRISIIEGDLPESDYWSMIAGADCFVSLHRSEGFGYGVAHSMALGVPTICSAFSGVLDFASAATSLLVPVELERVPRFARWGNQDLGVWGVADIEVAANHMRRVCEGDEEIRRMVSSAKSTISEKYSPTRFRQSLRYRLHALTEL